MGLNQDGGRKQYLHVSCGFLKGKHLTTNEALSGRSFTGHLLNIERFDDEYEGKPLSKIRLTLKDEAEEHQTVINFTEESWYAVGFFARIMGIDINKPLTLGCSGSDQNEKISFCWMKQGADKIEKRDDVVAPVKKMVPQGRGKEDKAVYDWTLVFPFFDKCTEVIVEKIGKSYGGIKGGGKPEVSGNTIEQPVTGPAADDDLPF